MAQLHPFDAVRLEASRVLPMPAAHETARAERSRDYLRAAMSASVQLTALQDAAVQLRLVAFLLAGSMIFALADPALLLMLADASLLYQVAASTSLHPQGLALLFAGLAAMLVPYLVLQMGPLQERRRSVVKLTCWALALAALLWAFLAWRSAHLDLGMAAPLLFARNGLGALLFALVLSASLNAERLRALFEAVR